MKENNILGIRIDDVSKKDAIEIIGNFLIHKRSHQVATVNPEFITTAQKDEEFKEVLNSSDLNIPDGYGLNWVSKYLLHRPITNRVPGIDLMLSLCKYAEIKKYPIFLLGGENGSGKKAAEVLQETFPKLKISGVNEGYPDFSSYNKKDYDFKITDLKAHSKDANSKLINQINLSNPKILFVAYGAPKQDKFIYRYKNILNVPVMMGVGGSFDFISGKSVRAPKWMQNIGLEWLWRLFKEPWRFKRIINAIIIFPLEVLKSKYFSNVN